MILEHEITKRLFIWGVVAVAVVPRQHIDTSRWSIGGNLSHSFKKLLLSLTAINMIRLVLKIRLLSDILGVLQQLGTTFLCFLTPYILQTWLAPLVNIGGRPGQSLMPTLYTVTFLSILAVVLVRTTHPNFWCLRKIGSAISSIPVLTTLTMFNTVTTQGGRHHAGRGTITAQSLMVIEYWHIVTQLLCAIGFGMNRWNETKDYDQWDQFLSSFREISFISDWTRVLAHALFVNQLDELYLVAPQNAANDRGHEASVPESGQVPDGQEMVSLINKSRRR